MLLKDKVAVISDAASPRDIGMATAQLFAEHGAGVAILDLNEAASTKAARDLDWAHRGFNCDMTNRESTRLAANAVLLAFGQAGVLINNARYHAAAEDHGHRAAEPRLRLQRQSRQLALLKSGVHSAHARV